MKCIDEDSMVEAMIAAERANIVCQDDIMCPACHNPANVECRKTCEPWQSTYKSTRRIIDLLEQGSTPANGGLRY